MALGYIGNDFDLGVIPEEENYEAPHHFIVYFNFHTTQNTGELARLNCRATGALAYNIYNEFKKGDTLFLYGQAVHKYDVRSRSITNQFEVFGYNYFDTIKNEPTWSEEKRLFMAQASELFDKAAPLPTVDDLRRTREIWAMNHKPKQKEKK